MDLMVFLRTTAPLLTTLVIFTLLFILLSKSIKKHANIYYIGFSIPFFIYLIPAILGWCSVDMEFSFIRVPVLGEILRDYIHMGSFGHPLLIIIMYTGALDPKVSWVKKLYGIRKELSIISGFPVLTHSIVRIVNNLPDSLKFFTNNAEYMENARVASELGAGISSFSFALGVVMVAIYLPLWVTSFDSVRKRMEAVKWKKLQKWAYVLYTTLFIHAMGIQTGGMLNPRGEQAPRAATEVVAAGTQRNGGRTQLQANPENRERPQERQPSNADAGSGERNNGQNVQGAAGQGNSQQAVVVPPRGGRAPSVGIPDIKVSQQTRQKIHIGSLILIFGSYLYLRLRKAKRDAAKKQSKTAVVNM